RTATGVQLIAKGALWQVLDVSTRLATGQPLDAATRAAIDAQHAAWTARGYRLLAVATRALPERAEYNRKDEAELSFEGFLTFLDQPKAGAREALQELGRL